MLLNLSAVCRAHPRSRGDHAVPTIANPWPPGSSPLARGPHWGADGQRFDDGLIPARAGTTTTFSMRCAQSGAHPRSRGDHVVMMAKNTVNTGSSPLARGPRLLILVFALIGGLIPARAGTTITLRRQIKTVRAHPRSRGDHRALRKKFGPAVGSSPLARGPHLLTWGFTPYISKIESL